MSDTDIPDYLRDDYDPSTSTMAMLRSHLIAHDIHYPSDAKKPALVEIFNQQLVPQRATFRARTENARRSSRGIVNAGSANDTPAYLYDDDYEGVSGTTVRPRRSASPRKWDNQHVAPLQPTAASRRTTRGPMPEEPLSVGEGVRSTRISRHRTPDTKTAAINSNKEATPNDDPLRSVSSEGNFSHENPFQRSSPAVAITKSGSRRKTTSVANNSNSVRISSNASRRRSHQPRTSTEAHLNAQLYQVDKYEDDYDNFDEYEGRDENENENEDEDEDEDENEDTGAAYDDLEPGEEFTPEAQLELELEEKQNRTVRGKGGANREKFVQPRTKSSQSLTTPLTVLFMGIVAGCALWYRQEKLAVGYCGLGRPATQIFPAGAPVPAWMSNVMEPQCEPCPPHAYCHEEFVAHCEPGYLLKPHPLSLGGIVPLPPTCEADSVKVRRVKAVADRAVEELRGRRALYECGIVDAEKGEPVGTPTMDAQELKESVSKKRGKRLSSRDFDELWEEAIGEIAFREEVQVEQPENTNSGAVSNSRYSSTSLARVPLACSLKRSFWLTLARYRLYLGAIMSLVMLVFYGRAKYRAHQAARAQVPALVNEVLKRLAGQKELGEEGFDDRFLFLPNLRDDVLREVHSLAGRERLWKLVRAVVEQNSNVRTGQQVSATTGELGLAWEWIGPTSGNSEVVVNRRRSRMSGFGRPSFGPGIDADAEVMPVKDTEVAGTSVKTWQDPRPVY